MRTSGSIEIKWSVVDAVAPFLMTLCGSTRPKVNILSWRRHGTSSCVWREGRSDHETVTDAHIQKQMDILSNTELTCCWFLRIARVFVVVVSDLLETWAIRAILTR